MMAMKRKPLYFSQTLTVGKRTYLMEVRRTLRGQKYFIIERTDLRDEDQEPVIIYEHSMLYFARAIDRATRAVLNTVPEVEPADERQAKREASKTERQKREPTKPKARAAKKKSVASGTKKVAKKAIVKPKKDRPRNQGKRWSEDHISLLTIHYSNGMSVEELAELLGRGEFSVKVQASQLGLKRPKG